MADAINPLHYKQGKVECIDAIESATVHKTGLEAFCVGNVIKYCWRYEAKNGLEDVKKAQHYLNKLIAYLETKDKKPIQYFKPQTIATLDNMPCISTPQYSCEAVIDTTETVTGPLKVDNNSNIYLD